MSYVLTKRNRRRTSRRPPPRGMSGITDWLGALFSGPADLFADGAKPGCGVDSSQVAVMFARIGQVGTQWNPTGVYTPQDVFTVTGLVADMTLKASTQIQNVRADYDVSILQDAQRALDDVGSQTYNYTLAAQQAQATSSSVSAPGMKQYVLDAMNASLNGMMSAAAAACNEPLWLMGLVAFQTSFDAVWTQVVAVAGVALDLAKKVVKAAEGALDLVAWLEEYGGYAAVGLAAWWIFLREKKKR